MWNEQWATMREQFLLRAKDRLNGLGKTIDEWEQASFDGAILQRIHKDFHWLAGVGGTYQLPELSALGGNAEEICLELSGHKRVPSADDAKRLREILDSVNSIVGSATAAT
jgi:chemotaxis protein histidine kinase CheA